MPAFPSFPVLLFAGLYAVTLALVAGFFGPHNLALSAALAVPLVWLSVTDLERKIIPDTANALVALIGLARHLSGDLTGLQIDLAAAIIVFLVLWIASEVYWRRNQKEALGLGDVKLLAAGTFCVGTLHIWQVILCGSVGGILAYYLARRGSRKVDSGIPFGPFLAYGLFLTFTVLVDQ